MAEPERVVATPTEERARGRGDGRPSLAAEPDRATVGPAPRVRRPGSAVVRVLTSTDHKVIGYLYLTSAFVFFLFAGVLALLMRAELAAPGMQLFSPEQDNQLFTMHGTVMLLLFATPVFAGFANVLVPLQIGAPDVAFPRLNLLGRYLFVFGGVLVVGAALTPQGAADFGWTAYTPLSTARFSQGSGGNLWLAGLAIAGIGTILSAVNFIATITAMRAPGMTMWRMPIFTWNARLTSVLVLLPFPIVAACFIVLLIDRTLGSVAFAPENGGPILWQHLFWFFGHPEVYILALPFFGITTEIIPVFSRKPVFGYRGMVFASVAIVALSTSVWAHHMYATGAVLLPYFALMTMLIAVPTGIKFFNWIGTMWRGSVSFEPPMLWAMGFLVTFLFGGLTGVIVASPPLDWHVTDSYFVVAHFHYVLFGTVVFAMFGGFYFWWPKFTGLMLSSRLADLHFWLTFLGFHTTFLVQLWLGVEGMPGRYADYLPQDGFTTLNVVVRGSGDAPWSGPPPARRLGTTSRRCRASGRTPRRSTCTTPRWRPGRVPSRWAAGWGGCTAPPRSTRDGAASRRAPPPEVT